MVYSIRLIYMPPKKATTNTRKKTVKDLENEASEMESCMEMLRKQIEEEREKVKGPRWAAAAEGPISKFDPHGQLARKILSKKKEGGTQRREHSPRIQPPMTDPKNSPPRPHSEITDPRIANNVPPPKLQPRKIDIVVEPQGGALWGNYCDSSVQPDVDEGSPKGGSLWGPPPNEAEESAKFQEEISKLRGEQSRSNKVDSSNVPDEEPEPEPEPELPPSGGGGALWGPPPDEQEEQLKFQREVAKFRGEPPPSFDVSVEDNGTAANLVSKNKMAPTAFTYFDKLVTRDILDGTPAIGQKPK